MRAADLIGLGLELEVRGDNLVVHGDADPGVLDDIRRHKHRLIAELLGKECCTCVHWWRRADGDVGDCQRHQFETFFSDDCFGWESAGRNEP